MPTPTETDANAAARDMLFVQELITAVTENPTRKLDDLCAHMRQLGYGRGFVNEHLPAITTAMLKARGELP